MRLVTLRVTLGAARHRHRGPGTGECLGRQHGVSWGRAGMLLRTCSVEICCLCLPTDEVLMSTGRTGPARSGGHTGMTQPCTSVQWSDKCSCTCQLTWAAPSGLTGVCLAWPCLLEHARRVVTKQGSSSGTPQPAPCSKPLPCAAAAALHDDCFCRQAGMLCPAEQSVQPLLPATNCLLPAARCPAAAAAACAGPPRQVLGGSDDGLPTQLFDMEGDSDDEEDSEGEV